MRCSSVVICVLVMISGGWLSAGDLEPSAPPGPTMKTLNEIPPTWTQVLDTTDGLPDGCNSSRFKCIHWGVAVLDMETGLVWQRSPFSDVNNYAGAKGSCFQPIGGWLGWRAPTTAELTSLMSSAHWYPSLPTGHPFLDVEWVAPPDLPIYYVTTTEFRDSSGHAYIYAAEFAQHRVGRRPIENVEFRSWCVRGPE